MVYVNNTEVRTMTRREFLAASAAVGVGLAVAPAIGQEAAPKDDPINLAIIGAGEQARVLLESLLRLPDIRIKAVCDIWEYSQNYVTRYLKKYGHDVASYEDYRDLLDAVKDLDAVVIASPDFVHAEQTVACLKAGLHVYCECPMSNDLEGARSMVHAARASGRLLQIGHQRRSNLRYIHAIDNLLKQARLLGRITHAEAQWNRSISDDLGAPQKYIMSASKLEQHGYESMQHFRNWRWYKKYGGGPLGSLGTQQVDVLNWALGTPTAVVATGGTDYYKHREAYDNVFAVFEYETPEGTIRAQYRILSTTSRGRFGEEFMGVDGSMGLSEVPTYGNSAIREPHAPDWQPLSKKGWLEFNGETMEIASENHVVSIKASKPEPIRIWTLPIELTKPPHQEHLENFFDAIRKGTPLNCPAETGYEAAVAVHKVSQAIESGCKLKYEKSEFYA